MTKSFGRNLQHCLAWLKFLQIIEWMWRKTLNKKYLIMNIINWYNKNNEYNIIKNKSKHCKDEKWNKTYLNETNFTNSLFSDDSVWPVYTMIPNTMAAKLSLWSIRVGDGLAGSSGAPEVFTAITTSPISKTMDVAINRPSRWFRWVRLACSTYRWYNLSSYKCNSLQYWNTFTFQLILHF